MNAYMIPWLKNIDDLITEAFGVTIEQMRSSGRKRTGTEARQFAMWYRKRYAGEKPSVIGKLYGRDHATVLHAAKTVDNLIETNKAFRTKAEKALMLLEQIGK